METKQAAINEDWIAHYEYLEDLRDSGVTNMFGSPAYLQEEFGITFEEASKIVSNWMENYSELADRFGWQKESNKQAQDFPQDKDPFFDDIYGTDIRSGDTVEYGDKVYNVEQVGVMNGMVNGFADLVAEDGSYEQSIDVNELNKIGGQKQAADWVPQIGDTIILTTNPYPKLNTPYLKGAIGIIIEIMGDYVLDVQFEGDIGTKMIHQDWCEVIGIETTHTFTACYKCGKEIDENTQEWNWIKTKRTTGRVHHMCAGDLVDSGGYWNEIGDTVVFDTEQEGEEPVIMDGTDKITESYNHFKNKDWDLSNYQGIDLKLTEARKVAKYITSYTGQKIADENTLLYLDDIKVDIDKEISDLVEMKDDVEDDDIETTSFRINYISKDIPDFVNEGLIQANIEQKTARYQANVLTIVKQELRNYLKENSTFDEGEKSLLRDYVLNTVDKHATTLSDGERKKLRDKALNLFEKEMS